jgi:hypothetical protein
MTNCTFAGNSAETEDAIACIRSDDFALAGDRRWYNSLLLRDVRTDPSTLDCFGSER